MYNLRPRNRMDPSEHIYIQRILNGEKEVFGLLVNTYSQQVFQLIVRIVRNQEDAEELAQDCFMKAFRTLDKFKGECQFSTWLYRIAYNTAISSVRKKKQEFLYIDEKTINEIPDKEVNEQFENEINEQQLQQLNEAISLLLPDERGILQLFYKENKSIEEITIVTGLTTSNVKVKLHRLRKKLYLILSNQRY